MIRGVTYGRNGSFCLRLRSRVPLLELFHFETPLHLADCALLPLRRACHTSRLELCLELLPHPVLVAWPPGALGILGRGRPAKNPIGVNAQQTLSRRSCNGGSGGQQDGGLGEHGLPVVTKGSRRSGAAQGGSGKGVGKGLTSRHGWLCVACRRVVVRCWPP